jgi:hypothetical protein
VGAAKDNWLDLGEPFVYLVLMHLGIGANFLGLLDASSIGFFRICTQQVVSDQALASRKPAETFEDRAFLVLISYLFNLKDLKKANVIDWRVIIDFLVDFVESEPAEKITASEILKIVAVLQEEANWEPLFSRGEEGQLAEQFPVALRKLRTLIKGLPETPRIPLYCFTPVTKLAPLVNRPPRGLDWLFTPPRQVPTEWDPEYTDEACIERLTEYLRILADALIDFFFVRPRDDLPSRGQLFGFRETLPPEAADMVIFLEEQVKTNLRMYCGVVARRLSLLLALDK